ncbi:MAG: M28 family peptidase [Acidobacteria bacterium]|nr:M28 family peptidase [Acidobacteriota bacterium]
MHNFRFYFAGLALVLSLVAATTSSQVSAQTKTAKQSTPTFGNVEGITAAQIKDYLEFIASDELEGRDTPSRGLNIAAKYIASHLSRWGLQPGGANGTYFQPFTVKLTKLDPTNSWAELNGQRFSCGEDFYPVTLMQGTFTAPLVYVGHGWVHKGKNLNAYQGLEVKDKVMISASGFPKGLSPNDLTGKMGEDWLSSVLYAQKNGAKALIIVSSFGTLANWATAYKSILEKGDVSFEKPGSANPQIPILLASPKFLTALFQGEKQNASMIVSRAYTGEPLPGFDLTAKKLSLSIAAKAEAVTTRNIVAKLEGSDPVLKNEYVTIGAHYDHVGIGAPDATGDTIYNGADDDGSGTTAVMAIAEAFAKGPRPKRSMLFVWHAGEEHGLWGSEYLTDNPPIPINQIITQLNIDMIGRAKAAGDTNPANQALPDPGEIFVIGSKMMSTELGELSERVNKSLLNLKLNYKYDDPNDPERYFYRSDHFNYARKGVPIIFYMDGNHADYHRPSDSIEKIDFQQMEKVARTIYATAWELGNLANRPRVDKPLPAAVAGN